MPRNSTQDLQRFNHGFPLVDRDPELCCGLPHTVYRMLGLIRNVDCPHPVTVERHLRRLGYAFRSIKPTDGVIVGMYPRFRDEAARNVALTRRFGA